MEQQNLEQRTPDAPTELPRGKQPEPNGQAQDRRQAPPPEPPARPRSRRKGLIIGLIVGVAIVIGVIWYWRYSSTYEDTDDAEVDAHLVGVSTRIDGTVTAVYAEQNQTVKAGDVLVEIDPSDYRIAVEQAEAQLSQAQAQVQAENPNVPITQTTNQTSITTTEASVANAEAAVAAAEGEYSAAQARLAQAQANNAKAQADVNRYGTLVKKDEVAREQYDQVVATAKALAAAVDSASASADAARKVVDQRRAQLAQAESQVRQAHSNAPQQLAISRATLASRQAAAKAAQARLDQAELNLSYTKVLAPVSGVVSKRNVEVGSTVQPGQQLFTISQIDDMWVTANFKETQLQRMHPGERATIHVDAFDQDFNGYVESMPAATGAITSLLPPENATGNYVKVVQRLPVRIRFDKNQPGLSRLRPGMSVEPKVWLQ
jgi:membrane fusion protein (multidrug efflux system)